MTAKTRLHFGRKEWTGSLQKRKHLQLQRTSLPGAHYLRWKHCKHSTVMTGALSNVLPLSKLFVYVLKTKQTKIIYVYIFGKLHLQGAGTLCISVFKSLCLGLFVNSKNTDVLEKHQLQDSHKKQAQAQDQSSWRSKNKICTHCLFTTDLISSEYKQSDSVITKYLGCKMKLLKDWKCSTGVTTLSTALWDGHIQNAVLALSPLHFWASQVKGSELEFFLIVALAKFHQKK